MCMYLCMCVYVNVCQQALKCLNSAFGAFGSVDLCIQFYMHIIVYLQTKSINVDECKIHSFFLQEYKGKFLYNKTYGLYLLEVC